MAFTFVQGPSGYRTCGGTSGSFCKLRDAVQGMGRGIGNGPENPHHRHRSGREDGKIRIQEHSPERNGLRQRQSFGDIVKAESDHV